LLTIYEKIYPPIWPLTGLQYLLTAKLEWYLQHTSETTELLRKGIPIVTITHGSSSPIVHNAIILLNESIAEQRTKDSMD